MKLLLAGPGTGKTMKIKDLIDDQADLDKILVISFTNATINDLLQSFKESNMDITGKNCLTLHKYALRVNHQKSLHILNSIEADILNSYAKKFNTSFEDICKTLSCITFEQMITQTTAYIKTNPAYLPQILGEIKLLVVDEYQDFNPTERELIDLIALNARDCTILGDDDQCIYEFKDADTDGIIALHKEKSVEKLPHENVCYRCPDCIVEACLSLISKNRRRVGKEWKKNNKSGEIEFKQIMTQVDTAMYIVDEIEKIKTEEPFASIMILSPVGFAIEESVTLLKNKCIEHTNFWISRIDLEKYKKIWEVRTILGDKKILNLLFLVHQNIKNKKGLLGKIEEIVDKSLDFETVLNLLQKNNVLEGNFSNLIKSNPSLSELTSVDEYSFIAEHVNESTLEDDLEKLSKIIVEPIQFDPKGVNIMSIHKSKGLQADYVFILGLVEGILPNVLRGMDSIEAQRRLLFVGMSRSRKNLYLMSTVQWEGKFVNKAHKGSFKYDYRIKQYLGRASTFISELNM